MGNFYRGMMVAAVALALVAFMVGYVIAWWLG
jgi:hypothetical protein